MSPPVVDASEVVPWLVPEAASEAALRLRGRELLAPDLLPSEAANALWKKVRRGELTVAEAETAAHLLRATPLRVRAARDLLPRAVRLAVELGHPAYDCVYLALAEGEGVPLVSDDRRLARAVVEAAGGRHRLSRRHQRPLCAAPRLPEDLSGIGRHSRPSRAGRAGPGPRRSAGRPRGRGSRPSDRRGDVALGEL